jgi:hypothetical protein
MHQPHRHINIQIHPQQQKPQKKKHLGQTTSPDLATTTATTTASSTVKMIRKRPDLTEVIRNLRFNGRDDVADLITKLSGTTESTSRDSVSSVNTSATATGTDRQSNGSGSRRKKYAYLYVNSTKASMDDQSKMLHGFIQTLKAKPQNRKSVSVLMKSIELIPITLPKNVVVLAMRLPLEMYIGSVIQKRLNGHTFMKAYLRKPRSDTQHLAETMIPQQQQQQSASNALSASPRNKQPDHDQTHRSHTGSHRSKTDHMGVN